MQRVLAAEEMRKRVGFLWKKSRPRADLDSCLASHMDNGATSSFAFPGSITVILQADEEIEAVHTACSVLFTYIKSIYTDWLQSWWCSMLSQLCFPACFWRLWARFMSVLQWCQESCRISLGRSYFGFIWQHFGISITIFSIKGEKCLCTLSNTS